MPQRAALPFRPAFALLALPLLAACGEGARLPAFFPGYEVARMNDPGYLQARGAVELLVKSNHPAILTEIANGGGPLMTQAMDLAGVPPGDRPARLIQIEGDRGLYEVNAGALVSALMTYGQRG